jgi:hypothetical protein
LKHIQINCYSHRDWSLLRCRPCLLILTEWCKLSAIYRPSQTSRGHLAHPVCVLRLLRMLMLCLSPCRIVAQFSEFQFKFVLRSLLFVSSASSFILKLNVSFYRLCHEMGVLFADLLMVTMPYFAALFSAFASYICSSAFSACSLCFSLFHVSTQSLHHFSKLSRSLCSCLTAFQFDYFDVLPPFLLYFIS